MHELDLSKLTSRELWRLFSSSSVRDLVSDRGGAHAKRILEAAATSKKNLVGAKFDSLYSQAFRYLAKNQPAEYFYKNAILQRFLISRNGSNNAKILFEFRVGNSKLDALVLNESLHAFEIKTARDHPNRLPNQIEDYTRRFAHVWVVSDERQANKFEKQLDHEIGIAFVSPRHSFNIVRKATRNTLNLKSEKILGSLRQQEYLAILREYGFSSNNIPNTKLYSQAMKFAERLDPELVHEATMSQLKSRQFALSVTSLRKIPLHLRAASVLAHLSENDVAILLKNLSKHVIAKERA
jgi:hypothetical protein